MWKKIKFYKFIKKKIFFEILILDVSWQHIHRTFFQRLFFQEWKTDFGILLFQGSPISYSNNPSAPSSPTGHVGPPLNMDSQNTSFFLDQVHDDFAQFSMVSWKILTTEFHLREYLINSH